MLKLEAFSARHGDALLLHYGTAEKPLVAMIDGGPPGVFKRVVAGRLRQLAPEGKIPRLRWVNVSHVDEDHIAGVISLFEGIKNDPVPPASADALFHNVPTPGDALSVQPQSGGRGLLSERDRLEQELAELIGPTVAAGVRTESFEQGAELANLGREINVPRNPPKGKRLLTGDTISPSIVKPLKVTVVAPSLQHFRDLVRDWRAELGPAGGVITSSTKRSIDTSVTNLSSLVLLVEQGDHKVLLTGDARADHIVEGLEELGLLSETKPLEVSVLKLPHHGSDRTTNVTDNVPGLLERVRAKHYLISADGRFANPDEAIVRRLVRAQGKRKCTVWLTTPEGRGGRHGPAYDAVVAALRDEIAQQGAKVTVKLPAADQTSVVVELEK